MTSKNLLIIGTFHYDRRGSEKLLSLLNLSTPEIIMIEHTTNRTVSINSLQENLERYLDHGYHIFISKFIHTLADIIGYEYKTCKDLAEIKKIRLESIDINNDVTERYSNPKILAKFFSAMINISFNCDMNFDDDTVYNARERELFDRFEKAFVQSSCINKNVDQRDIHMAKKISDLMYSYKEGIVVCGNSHVRGIIDELMQSNSEFIITYYNLSTQEYN